MFIHHNLENVRQNHKAMNYHTFTLGSKVESYGHITDIGPTIMIILWSLKYNFTTLKPLNVGQSDLHLFLGQIIDISNS